MAYFALKKPSRLPSLDTVRKVIAIHPVLNAYDGRVKKKLVVSKFLPF